MASSRYAVGLTGGIGCGKSTVAALFELRAICVIDADALAHQLTTAGGAAMGAIAAHFGPDFVTDEGALDRTRMRELAFRDDPSRKALEAILHPLIRQLSDAALASATSPYVILMIPLLFESPGWRERVDRALVVDCSEEEQVLRVTRRSGLAERAVRAIMARQVTRACRLALADDVVDNSAAQDHLDAAVSQLHQRYLELADAAARL